MNTRTTCTLVVTTLACCAGTLAQPAPFYDGGQVTVPDSPSSYNESVDLSTLFDFGNGNSPGEAMTVKWVRVELLNTVAGDLYLDSSCSVFGGTSDVVMAAYDAAGALVASDDTLSGNNLSGAALSFGSSAERTPPELPRLAGQNGATLPAGVYWFAVAAGTGSQVTIGASNWALTTTQGLQLGYGDNDTYIEWYITFGNTTPLPPPANNDCANALPVTEDVGATPAFLGTTAGATQDGTSPCYVPIQGGTYKDVWFSYTPSQSGFAQIVAGPGPGDNTSPILTLWDGGCGGTPVRCSGSGNFVLAGGTRLLVPVTQNVPVLLSVAMRAGDVGSLRLNIDLLPAPCTLVAPAGTITDGEACGDTSNDGCNTVGGTFGTISPGQSIIGTLYTTSNPQVRDRDWFRLIVTDAITAQLNIRGQAATEAVILGAPEQLFACSGPQLALARSADSLNPCAPASATAVLVPGEYFVAVAQLYSDNFSCSSGFNQYLLSLSGTPCDQPQVSQNPPATATVSLGGTISFTGALTSSEPVTYNWQLGLLIPDTNPPYIYWSDIFDGEFGDIFSTATLSGTDTGTLTITDIDSVMANYAGGIRFRLKGETCAPNYTTGTLLSITNVCGPSDVAGSGQLIGADGQLTADDIIVFIGWFFNADPRADVAGSGQVPTPDGQFTADDIILFVNRFFAGC